MPGYGSRNLLLHCVIMYTFFYTVPERSQVISTLAGALPASSMGLHYRSRTTARTQGGSEKVKEEMDADGGDARTPSPSPAIARTCIGIDATSSATLAERYRRLQQRRCKNSGLSLSPVSDASDKQHLPGKLGALKS